jgi:hypothetical protein
MQRFLRYRKLHGAEKEQRHSTLLSNQTTDVRRELKIRKKDQWPEYMSTRKQRSCTTDSS